MSVFDRLMEFQSQLAREAQRPFWTLDLEDDKPESDMHKWLTKQQEALVQAAKSRNIEIRKNIATYRGILLNAHAQTVTTPESRGTVGRAGKNPTLTVNHMLDMVEQHVARLTKFRPDVAAEPASDDDDDRMTAKIADELMEAFWYKENIDELLRRHNRVARICGESFIFILENPHKGSLHPDWIAETFKQNGIPGDVLKMKPAQIKRHLRDDVKEWPRIPLTGSGGEQVTTDGGDKLWIDRPVRIGDIEYKFVWPWNVHIQPVSMDEERDWVIYDEILSVDDVRADHPDKADLIDLNNKADMLDVERFEEKHVSKMVRVSHLYHRSTSRLDQGRYVKWTRGVILENTVNPYELDDRRIIPMHRMTDIEIPGMANGESTVRQGRNLQKLFNNSFSMVARNQFYFAHPKWMVPNGTVSVEALANQQSLVKYKGPQPPILAQPNPTGNETFQWMELVEENLQKVMGVFGQSRGEPPSGITAAVALAFLDEQESERANSAIAKHNDAIRSIARQTLSIMGWLYDDNEERLNELLGRSRASELSFFKFADLGNITDMRVATSSALPRQKASRLQTILDLQERFPEELSNRQVLDMLDLGQKDKYISVATTAVRMAEKEEALLDAKGEMPDVEEYELHTEHYRVHLARINDPSFKTYSTPAKKEKLAEHIAAHEMFMLQKAEANPIFLEQLMTQFPQFPAFFEGQLPVPQPAQPEGQEAPAVAPAELALAAAVPQPAAPGVENLAPIEEPPALTGIPPGVTEEIQ